MKIDYIKYNPTGNITILVETQIERNLQAPIAEKLMEINPDCEQVGFIENNEQMHLQMMGGEFCGNAALCFASYIFDNYNRTNSLEINISGVSDLIHVDLEKSDNSFKGSVSMPLPYQIKEHNFDRYKGIPVVYFKGIGHAIVTQKLPMALAKMLIRQWAKELKLDALGIMILTEDLSRVDPLVYVKATDTVVHENSCASGTCAIVSWIADSKKENTTITLNEPGGKLTATAEYDGCITKLIFTGNTEAILKNSIEIDIDEILNQ